jgi:hypothetical protein
MNASRLAPGIYVYNDVGLSKEFDSLMSHIESKHISWLNRDPSTHVEDITIYQNTEDLYLKEVYSKFQAVLEKYENDYLSNFNTIKEACKFSNREFIFFLKYLSGTRSREHFDDIENSIRRVSILYYPNDDYQGGEVVFPAFNVRVKPKSDQILIFPSSYVYNHYVTEVLNGTRYVAGSFLY